jgi:ribonuclease HII
MKTSKATMKESPVTRCERLLAFDAAHLKTFPPSTYFIGCDEVGRGSLMGPVVAAAVCWKIDEDAQSPVVLQRLVGLNDSKKMTALQRKVLLPVIQQYCHIGIGEASTEEIAQLNILGASMLAVERALQQIPQQNGNPLFHVLMDGRDFIPTIAKSQQSPMIKGDGQSALIAMASILAKEHRDTWVRKIDEDFPHYAAYGWSRNMGYPTVTHRQAIQRFGLTPYHRPSYRCLPS